MERMQGWESKLDKFVESRHNTRFEWGKHDCCLFACDAVKEITGEDPAYFFRGRYKDKTGAYELIKEYGGGGLEETLWRAFWEVGMRDTSRTFAGRGDVVMCNVPTAINEELPTLGVIGMSGKIYVAGTRRLQIFEKDSGARFWKV